MMRIETKAGFQELSTESAKVADAKDNDLSRSRQAGECIS